MPRHHFFENKVHVQVLVPSSRPALLVSGQPLAEALELRHDTLSHVAFIDRDTSAPFDSPFVSLFQKIVPYARHDDADGAIF